MCNLFIWSSLQPGSLHKTILKVIYIKLGPGSCKSKDWWSDRKQSHHRCSDSKLMSLRHETEGAACCQGSPAKPCHRLSAASCLLTCLLHHSLQLRWMGWTSDIWILIILTAVAWGAVTWRAAALKSSWRKAANPGVLLQQQSWQWPPIHCPVTLDSHLQKNSQNNSSLSPRCVFSLCSWRIFLVVRFPTSANQAQSFLEQIIALNSPTASF